MCLLGYQLPQDFDSVSISQILSCVTAIRSGVNAGFEASLGLAVNSPNC